MNRFRAWYQSKASRPLILAHRGDSFRGPENTLEAAELGFEAGADGWELDVRLTKDGVPVLLHDESLLRTTDVARRFEGDPREVSGFLVGEFTIDEVRSLDAGSWFVNRPSEPRSAEGFGSLDRLTEAHRARYESGRVRIPTLAEALALTVSFDGLVNVEIKPTSSDGTTLVNAVLSEVRSSGEADRVAISSFGHEIVSKVVALEPEVATGALVVSWHRESVSDLLRAVGADAVHAPPFDLNNAKSDVPVLVYTVNDAGPNGLAARLAEAGVSGLFTDDPASLAALCRITPSSTRTRSRLGIAGHRWAFPLDGTTRQRSR